MTRDDDPMTGRILDGRYQVGARIARGGMATVYEAQDLRLRRECAVKIMLPDLAEDQDFAGRFVREAHNAARLSHPNIVAVTDQGDDQGLLFLVMEHVRGRTLRDAIRAEAPMTPERALELLEPVLAALAEAHRCGIVHRDIKPENVLIADDGRVKVADFGLARVVDAHTQHTRTGSVLIGTVSYLAPEIIVNHKADQRSDVYAAGVLLYEMLTGRKPHEGEGAIQIAYKHVNEDIPPPSQATDQHIPAYLDALVARATARDRDRRAADAKVLLHQARTVRATLAAGVLEDPDLTADLLPAAVPHGDELDQTADGSGPAIAPWGHEDTADQPDLADLDDLDDLADREDTTVIDAAAARRAAEVPVAPAPATAVPAGAAPAATARPTRPRRSRRGPVLLALVLVATLLAAYAGWWLGIGRYTSTPGVINLSVAAATERLEDAGLELDVVETEFSETVTAGSVISTDPAAGERVLKGGTVEAVVSKGPERYAVPPLRGRPFEEVEGLLEDANLALGNVTRVFNETVPKGVVISASPGAGTELRRDTAVSVTVSKGPKPIDIPDFTGKKSERAVERLAELGFEVDVTEENSDDVAKGRVISQDPTGGIGYRGDVIELVVSKGPVIVTVPDLQSRSVEDATEILEGLGLRADIVRTQFYIGLDRVARQSPGEGDRVPKGSSVTLFVI